MRKIVLILSLFFAAALPHDVFAFGPCQDFVPRGVSYLPEVPVCGGKAAFVFSGKYINAFSAVLRDCNNNDRDPCHVSERTCGTNYSSPFKVQRIFYGTALRGKQQVKVSIHCLKERGDSKVYQLVRRMTIKMRNPVQTPSDIAKICLRSRVVPANPITIINTYASRSVGSTGINSACTTQKYLGCDYSYENVCPKYD